MMKGQNGNSVSINRERFLRFLGLAVFDVP